MWEEVATLVLAVLAVVLAERRSTDWFPIIFIHDSSPSHPCPQDNTSQESQNQGKQVCKYASSDLDTSMNSDRLLIDPR